MTTDHATDSATTVFSRVLVGIDGSDASLEAARQAARVAEGELTLLAVYDTAPAFVGTTGTMPPPYLDEEVEREGAENALRRARQELGERAAAAKVARGAAWDELIRELGLEHDTLVVVGSHGVGRMRGILMGSTATELIHRAPCSVLVARAAGAEFPRSIVVGVDGSPQSAAAHAAARRLAERFGATLSPVTAQGGKGVDRERAATIAGRRPDELPGAPAAALVAAAADADLLVVGSRGLHGLKSLGSVSERVAHEAGSSVLIVR